MADRYLLESGSPDGYLLEDGSGVYLLNAGDFTPTYLLGPSGAWYDFSDLTTLFQTGTRASPGAAVTADGDPVGLVLDKSGKNNDLVQATAGKRPLYKTGPSRLLFDGSDDFLASAAAFDISNTLGQIGAALAFTPASTAVMMACELGPNVNTTANTFYLAAVNDPGTGQISTAIDVAGSADGVATTSTSYGNGVTSTISFQSMDIAVASAATRLPMRRNGAAETVSVSNDVAGAGTAFSATQTLYVGARAGTSLFFSGSIYGIFIIGRPLAAGEIADLDTWMIAKTTGDQTLTPSLFTNSQTFYAPTVSPGSVTLTPSLFTNSQTFPAPTVVSTYPLTPALFTNSQTFFAPTVAPGPVTLTPALFTNAQSFFGPMVSPGTVTLTPDLFTNSQTFFAPSVTTGSVTLTPSLFTNSQSFFSATVSPGPVTLAPALFTNSQGFFAPTVTASCTLLPDLFTNLQTFFSPVVSLASGDQTLTPALFTNTNTFYSPTVSPGSVTLIPSLFTNSQTFYGATVIRAPTLRQSIELPLLVNAQVFFAARVTRIFLDTVIVPGANLVNEAMPPSAALGPMTEPSGQIVNAPPYPAGGVSV